MLEVRALPDCEAAAKLRRDGLGRVLKPMSARLQCSWLAENRCGRQAADGGSEVTGCHGVACPEQLVGSPGAGNLGDLAMVMADVPNMLCTEI